MKLEGHRAETFLAVRCSFTSRETGRKRDGALVEERLAKCSPGVSQSERDSLREETGKIWEIQFPSLRGTVIVELSTSALKKKEQNLTWFLAVDLLAAADLGSRVTGGTR